MRIIIPGSYGVMASLLATVLGASPTRAEAAGPPVIVSFDRKDDVEGFGYGAECQIENPGEGGNPGGYLRSACAEAFAGTFLGGADTERADLTGDRRFRIWTVSVDLKGIEGQPTGVFLRFRNRAQEGWLLNGWRYRLATSLSGDWTRYSVTFDPGWSDAEARAHGWDKDFADGAFSPSWADNMARVGTAEIRVEALEPLVVGIDNYTLVAVPWT
jgi:hypothetical protein